MKTTPNRRAGSSALILLLWLAAVLAFAAFSVNGAIRRASTELDVTGRTLHRLISQRVAQHDAHLTSLAALAGVSTPPPEAAIQQVASSIVRFYPRISGVFLVELGSAGEPLETLVSVSPSGQDPDLSSMAEKLAAQKLGEVHSYVSGKEAGHYLLAKRVPGEGQELAFVLVIDPAQLVESEERPDWARISLAVDGKTVLDRPVGLASEPWPFLSLQAFEKVVDSKSQPLELRVQHTLLPGDVIEPGPLMAFALVSLLALLALQFAWRQRVDAHSAQRAAAEAEQRASLREHEARLAHASRVNAMGELASGIAHELTQPLTALLSQSQAALRLASMPKPDLALVSDVLGANVREAKRAGTMIERMRAYVSNRQAEPVRTGINGIVSDTAALISVDLEKRGIRLILELSDDDPQAVVDAIEMEQVVHNLLRNAADAMVAAGAAEPRIIVRTATSRQFATIEVEDNGPGIADTVLPRLFEPFFTTKQDGMGLGLALCETLVERVDGRIEATNVPGSGACFTVTLPASEPFRQAAQ